MPPASQQSSLAGQEMVEAATALQNPPPDPLPHPSPHSLPLRVDMWSAVQPGVQLWCRVSVSDGSVDSKMDGCKISGAGRGESGYGRERPAGLQEERATTWAQGLVSKALRSSLDMMGGQKELDTPQALCVKKGGQARRGGAYAYNKMTDGLCAPETGVRTENSRAHLQAECGSVCLLPSTGGSVTGTRGSQA